MEVAQESHRFLLTCAGETHFSHFQETLLKERDEYENYRLQIVKWHTSFPHAGEHYQSMIIVNTSKNALLTMGVVCYRNTYKINILRIFLREHCLK